MNRRYFLNTLFTSALSSIVLEKTYGQSPGQKSIVFLHMNGGPSQIDLFDYKEELYRKNGKSINYFKSEKGQIGGTLLKPISTFKKRGESGIWVSDLLPNISKHVDQMTIIHSLSVTSLNHYDAQLEQFTGTTNLGGIHVGHWINDYLYKNNKLHTNIPNFILMHDELGEIRSFPDITDLGLNTSPKSFISFSTLDSLRVNLNNIAYSGNDSSFFINLLSKLNKNSSSTLSKKRLDSLKLVLESKNTLIKTLSKIKYDYRIKRIYGVSKEGENSYVDQLLFAKELIKLGIPLIQINSGDTDDASSWDHHFKLSDLNKMCSKIDLATSGFIKDLQESHLLQKSAIFWGGEFGRLPIIDEKGAPENSKEQGRGHNNLASTCWIIDDGVKKGHIYGETDEIGLKTVSNKVHYGDIWATLLYLINIDHRDLKIKEADTIKTFTKKSDQIIKNILT